ncbi:hypothetical protein [Cypionkella sp. TWP1-2-1b2]
MANAFPGDDHRGGDAGKGGGCQFAGAIFRAAPAIFKPLIKRGKID